MNQEVVDRYDRVAQEQDGMAKDDERGLRTWKIGSDEIEEG